LTNKPKPSGRPTTSKSLPYFFRAGRSTFVEENDLSLIHSNFPGAEMRYPQQRSLTEQKGAD
jgi:hypothetical protein